MKLKDPDIFDKRGLKYGSSDETFNQNAWRIERRTSKIQKLLWHGKDVLTKKDRFLQNYRHKIST